MPTDDPNRTAHTPRPEQAGTILPPSEPSAGTGGLPDPDSTSDPSFHTDEADRTAPGADIKLGAVAENSFDRSSESTTYPNAVSRAGSVVSRYYGRSEGLLARYGWYLKNGDERARPVGQLRPNELGLFDMLGNALEWVEDPAKLYIKNQKDDIENKKFLLVDDRESRILRG